MNRRGVEGGVRECLWWLVFLNKWVVVVVLANEEEEE